MTKNIKKIDNYEFDERFYQYIKNGVKYYNPSVTYILGCAYPSNFELSYWRGDVGNKRADEILEETSADGSFVHESIEQILNKQEISSGSISTKFSPRRSLKIKRCLKAFLDWCSEFKPEIISTEFITWNDEYKFAGTVDLKCKIGQKEYVIDFKTSKSIHPSHKVQVCAYALSENIKNVALLHLGNTTKKKYSFLELKPEDLEKYTKEFLQVNELFQTLYPNAKPTEETFPDSFKL